jgi:hypothetical protein
MRFPAALPVWVPAKLELFAVRYQKKARQESRETDNRAKQKARQETREAKKRAKARQATARQEAHEAEKRAKKEARNKAREAKARAKQTARQEAREAKVRAKQAAHEAHAKTKKEHAKAERERHLLAAKEARKRERQAKGYSGEPGKKRRVISGTLVCLDCGPRPLAEFRIKTLRKTGRKYFESRCDACRRVRCIARNHNIPLGRYQEIMQQAGGKCAICGRSESKLVLDHCHATGKIRGALCQVCNTALATLEAEGEFLDRAVDYLRCWREAPMTETEKAEVHERERRWARIRDSRKALP